MLLLRPVGIVLHHSGVHWLCAGEAAYHGIKLRQHHKVEEADLKLGRAVDNESWTSMSAWLGGVHATQPAHVGRLIFGNNCSQEAARGHGHRINKASWAAGPGGSAWRGALPVA